MRIDTLVGIMGMRKHTPGTLRSYADELIQEAFAMICAATLCVIIVYFSPGHRLHYICVVIYSDSGQAIDVPIIHTPGTKM